jgi:very-short-patch-repair endonuclease
VGNPIRDVIDFARRHGGVVTTNEAMALGMTSSTIQRRVDEGVFFRHQPGVLALPGVLDTLLLDLHVATRKLQAVVSHESAAYVHELDRPRHVKPSVIVARNNTKDLVGVTVHQVGDLTPSHVADIGGLPVTTSARTIVDLSAVLSEGHLSRIVDNGLAAGRLDLDDLHSLFAELGRRGKPGTAKLRRILDIRTDGYRAPDSELERRLVGLIMRARLPVPIQQFHAPWLRPLNGRVDLAYPDRRLVIEGDSRRWHLLAEGFESDRLRDNAAQLAGWRILRFTWSEIVDYPERVASTIQRALELERI